MRSRLYSLWLAVVAVIAACALGILGLPAAAFAQSPAVTFTPSSGPVGTSFTITGSNWMPGGQVPSTLPYGSPGWFTGYQAPTVDANGKFSYTETVGTGPGGPTPSGTYTYTYVENSLSATQTFTVTGQSSGAAPHITGYTTYTQGVMVILSVTYTGTADGFGFKGINGSGWAEENHPLSSPSYGHVSPGKIEYPFNHACGTSNADQSDVAFWVYTGAARNETTAHLACSGQSTDNDGATTGNGTASNGGVFVCLGGSNCNGIPNPGSTANAKPYTWDNYLTYLEQFYGGAADANLSLKCTEGASTGSLDDLVAGCLSLLWKDAPPIVRTIFSTVFDGLKCVVAARNPTPGVVGVCMSFSGAKLIVQTIHVALKAVPDGQGLLNEPFPVQP